MSSHKSSLLVVDDEPAILPALQALLSHEFHILTADCGPAAQEVFAREEVHLVLSDQRMPSMSGVELLEWVRRHHPKTVRLLMTGYAELEDAVQAINRGQVYHYLLKPWRIEELRQVLRNASEKYWLERNREHLLDELKRLNTQLEKRVHERTQELEQANHLLELRTRELEKLALTDPLTGLLNRRAIDDVARAELKRQVRYRGPLALGLIDADHFKEINRRYLLPGGDQVLIGLARILAGSLRTVDTLGRIGGEEFLVIAPETNIEGAAILAERIRSTVQETPILYKDECIPVTVSVGFAVADDRIAEDYDQIKLVAAQALGEAKATGRNRCVVRTLPRERDKASTFHLQAPVAAG